MNRHLTLQSETLNEMKDLKERMRKNVENRTPKSFQARARALFQSVTPFLKFNERGEIYNSKDQIIENSQLEDLIQYAVRDRRRSHTPAGWAQFRHLLRAHNVPRFMLNRDTLEEMEKDEAIKPEPTNVKLEGARGEVKSGKLIKKEETSQSVRQRSVRERKPNTKYSNVNFLQNY